MKTLKYLFAALLAVPFMASCSEEEYNAPVPAGNPVATAQAPAQAVNMGDSVAVTVNCTDDSGKALSTLKGKLLFSGVSVAETTVRTKTPGDYIIKLAVPYTQSIPDGNVDLQLTLQNVTTKASTTTLSVPIRRPHFTNLQFVDAEGKTHAMTETGDHLYATTVETRTHSFKGHFATADGRYTFGEADGAVAFGTTADCTFTTMRTGTVTVTLDTRDYVATPTEELTITSIDLADNDASRQWTGDLIQNGMCSITAGGEELGDDWYYDPDFFTRGSDGTFSFNAVDGRYTVKADFATKSLRIWAMNGNSPATIAADGSGALWIIGSEGINKPTWKAVNHGWWTGTDNALCLAQVSPKVYQITLTVGQQLDINNVNFKFFGQCEWGIEFAPGTAYSITTESPYIIVGDGTGGHDKGNVYVADGVTLPDGATIVLTVDLTKGNANGVLTVNVK